MARLCTLMGIRHSPRTPYSPWTNGLVEVQNKNFGTHIRMFLQNTTKNWAHQVHMYAFAHNSQPLSALNVSPHELVFHIRPRIPLTFDLNLNRNKHNTCISQYCSQLPEHSQYDKTDLNPIFYKTFSKSIPQWFLAAETAMLQTYTIVHNYTLKKLNSQAYITKTYQEGKPLPLGTFVLKLNFTHVNFSDKLKPLRTGPYKILDRLSDVTYELLSQDGSTFHIHRNNLIPHYPKEPLLYPHVRNFMRFSDSINADIPKPTKYANSDSSSFLSDISSSDEDEPSNTTHPYSSDNPSNDTTSYNTINKTRDANLYHTRIRHPTDNSSLPISNDTSQDRHLKSHYRLRQQLRKEYRLILSPPKSLNH